MVEEVMKRKHGETVNEFNARKAAAKAAAVKQGKNERRKIARLARETSAAAAKKAAFSPEEFEKMVEVERARMDKKNEAARSKTTTGPRAITAARDSLSSAFDLMGGVPALVAWGRDNMTEFYRLWARLIPKESIGVTAQLPLEDLLDQLSSKEGMSVAEAALQVGEDTLAAAREAVIIEDQSIKPLSSDISVPYVVQPEFEDDE